MQSERLPDDPADSIPLYRAACRAHSNGKADTGAAGAARAGATPAGFILGVTVHSHSEESIAETLSVRVGRIELSLAADTPFRRET
jgi:hypothetical protein